MDVLQQLTRPDQARASARRHASRPPLARLLPGLVLSSTVGLLAYKRRSLSRDGALGAAATGTSIIGLGGWSWGLALLYFFVSSTLLSHFREKQKADVAADKFSKGSQRDIAQLAANGGMASLYAVAAGSTHSEALHETFQAGFVGALATATADTWATEVGVLSPTRPRLLTTGKPVAPGVSGGVTLPGLLASTLGAYTLGLSLWVARGLRKPLAALPWIALLSGLAGSLCDSLLGATVQAMYFCPTCQSETERSLHSCGTRTRPLRGLSWCNNDVVNFCATFVGSLVAMVLYAFSRLPFVSQKRTVPAPKL